MLYIALKHIKQDKSVSGLRHKTFESMNARYIYITRWLGLESPDEGQNCKAFSVEKFGKSSIFMHLVAVEIQNTNWISLLRFLKLQ